jgi:acetylornithine/succinyldiaminopimelate/putrescine aminotransferase
MMDKWYLDFQYVTYNNVDELKAVVKEVQAATDGRGLAAVRFLPNNNRLDLDGRTDEWRHFFDWTSFSTRAKNHSSHITRVRVFFFVFSLHHFLALRIQIMMEALQGEGGIIPGDPTFFQTVRALCDETGAFMICDEVQIGMGRSGKLWGYENLNVAPDIFTSAKALGGGVPIGAMMARGVAADVFGPGDHASTYGGNPLACAAGLAVAKYMCDHDSLGNVMARGNQLSTGLTAMAKRHSALLGTVRGWGLLKGIEIVAPNVTPGQVVQAAMDEGLLLVGAGSNVVRFVPPLIVTEAEIESALSMLETAVAKVEAKLVVAVEA